MAHLEGLLVGFLLGLLFAFACFFPLGQLASSADGISCCDCVSDLGV
jgi:hypothetical protein